MLGKTVLNLVKCTCRTTTRSLTIRSISTTAINRFNSSSSSSSSSSSTDNSQVPWFISEPTPLNSSQPSPTSPRLATAPIPLSPPSTLPEFLHPLYSYLTISPFLNRDKITFINARDADPDGSWVEWIIVTELKKGREGGLRGAIEGVRTFLAKSPVTLSPSPSPTPFAPPSSKPLISGLPTPPSKHARSRAPSPSRADQASGWVMLDAGGIVVHVMTSEARENWGIEALWEGIKRESERQGGGINTSERNCLGSKEEVMESLEEEGEDGEAEVLEEGEEREREESEADEWEKKVLV